jgi:hypothetical protein
VQRAGAVGDDCGVDNWPTWALASAVTAGIATFAAFLVASAEDGLDVYRAIATACLGLFAALAAQELRRRRANDA